MTKPLVSVLINTYNHERFIEQAISSVLEQDLPAAEMEVVVVDDGSTDRTPEIVRKFRPRVRLVQKANGGQASAFNAAIPETNAPIVAFLDGDDWWVRDKLQAVLKVFSENPDIPAVGHAFYDTLEDGTPAELVIPENVPRIGLKSPEEARIAMVAKCCLATSKLTVRRWVLERMGPIPEELVSCADEPIMDSALALGGAILLDRPLCFYRYHSNNFFGFDSEDPARNRKRYQVQAFLAKFLPELLARFGVTPELISIVLERFVSDTERFEAMYDGGRWQMFHMEMRSFRRQFKNPSLGFLFFKAAVGALTLLLPPARFDQARRWYAKKNLHRVREVFGDAEPSFPAVCKRVPLLKRD